MADEYTVDDLVETITISGGIFEALSGVSSEDIKDPELAELWRQAEEKVLELEPLIEAIEDRLEALEALDDLGDEI
jgi:hypothetical protein